MTAASMVPGIGHYPRSLLGTDIETVSNAYPPTVCFLLVGIWSIGAVMLLRPRSAAGSNGPRRGRRRLR